MDKQSELYFSNRRSNQCGALPCCCFLQHIATGTMMAMSRTKTPVTMISIQYHLNIMDVEQSNLRQPFYQSLRGRGIISNCLIVLLQFVSVGRIARSVASFFRYPICAYILTSGEFLAGHTVFPPSSPFKRTFQRCFPFPRHEEILLCFQKFKYQQTAVSSFDKDLRVKSLVQKRT